MASLHLPQEIITEIIRRLPLRCKLLSKQWKNLISDPKFYTLYNDISHTAFFHGRDGLYCVSITDADDNKAHILGLYVPPFTVHRVLSDLYYSTDLIGSSHGIACLHDDDDIGSFLLYNLFTGSLQTVAYTPRQELCSCFSHNYYGFGYDYYSDDYKIFVSCKHCRCGIYSLHRNKICWIYSYRNKEWNSFKGFPYEDFTLSGEVAYSFNGVLHWAAVVREGDNKKETIVTYDLHTNRFGEIQVPPSLRDGVAYSIRMSEVDGQLCYVCRYQLVHEGNKIETDVWVMKEYGVRDSWERFTIQGQPKFTLPTTLLYKVGEGGCGRLVLFVHEYGKPLIWCNVDNNRVYVVSEKKWRKKMMKSNKKGEINVWQLQY